MSKTFTTALLGLSVVACASMAGPAAADTNLCPTGTVAVELVQSDGQHTVLLKPDAGSDTPDVKLGDPLPRLEWNGLGRLPADAQLQLQCYKTSSGPETPATVMLNTATRTAQSCVFDHGVANCTFSTKAARQ